MVLDELPHGHVLPPPEPVGREDLLLVVLSDSNSFNVFLHQVVVMLKHSLACIFNFSGRVVLLMHQFFHIVNFSHGSPVLSPDRTRVEALVLQL